MNYPQLKEYLKEQLEITIDKTVKPHKETITGLQEEFLTTYNLTEDAKLTEAITRFYQSVVATINNDNKYHQLPAYETLTDNYLATNKLNLGLKSEIEEVIADQHYQLLDQIIKDFQQSLEDEDEQEETNFSKAQTQAQSISQKIDALLITQEENEIEKPETIKRILTNCSEGKVILTEIKTWLTAYQQLTNSEQEQLSEEFTTFKAIDQAQIKEKDKEKDNTETTAKDETIKNKEELLYLGGFILILGVLGLLFSKK